MISIKRYISQLTDSLINTFGSRLLYVGLQGSYMRGEATESSDIDIMIVIDGLTVHDLDCYKNIIYTLEQPDKACGFVCSRTDLANWNPLEICHLLNTTLDFYGSLSQLVPAYTKDDLRNFIKISINNLYHEICHGYIHSDEATNYERLPYCYKSVFFILQNLYYLNNGVFIKTKKELLSLINGRDYAILNLAIKISSQEQYNFADSFNLLFSWCQDTLKGL